MITAPVYVPNPDAGDAALALGQLAPGSAIIGLAIEGLSPHQRVEVYYEGNIFGAANMVTYADRAMFAYWRMRDRYPTVAQAALRRRALLHVGDLLPEHGRIDPVWPQALARWLALDVDDLEPELRCQGVRV